MGRSDPGPLPRDTVSEVNDVVALLSAARVRPPYILVGHSMGGFNARLFASLHPDDVKGMVLIDPSIENQIAILEAAAPAIAANDQRSVEFLRSCADPRLSDSDFRSRCARTAPKTFSPALATAYAATQSRAHYIAFAAEVDAFFNVDSQQVIDRRRSFGAMPLIVLTRGERSSDLPPEQAEFEWNFLDEKHGELAQLSTVGQHRIVAGASHYIHQDKPDVVVDAIREVLHSARETIDQRPKTNDQRLR